jgi:hypothetical protein
MKAAESWHRTMLAEVSRSAFSGLLFQTAALYCFAALLVKLGSKAAPYSRCFFPAF